jgi:hypothetical protein
MDHRPTVANNEPDGAEVKLAALSIEAFWADELADLSND